MKRFSSVQKLQATTECGKSILSHVVRLKFILKSSFSQALLDMYMYISSSTKHGECTWQSLTRHMENVFEQ